MTGPLFRDGGVLEADGQVLAIGESAYLRYRHPDAEHIDLGGSVILPGLVNAHTHLELSGLTPIDAPTAFGDWIVSLPERLGRPAKTPEEIFPAAAAAGAAESLRFGVTCVGDITQYMDLTRPVLSQTPLRVVSYGEVIGLAGLQPRFDELFPRAVSRDHATPRLTIGLTPHAPYTVDGDGYRRCVAAADDLHLRLATHLAETPDEAAFLATRSGPFRELWDRLGLWDNFDPPGFAGGPIRFVGELGLADRPALLAHVNYADDDELTLLARGVASVVYCPRTHAFFGHRPHRWREMFARGINVAVGTDSRASSPDLNLIDDLRLLHRLAPEVAPISLWHMATTHGARALQLQGRVGCLKPGSDADLVAFPVTTNDPLAEILEAATLPMCVFAAGVRVV